MKVDSPDFALAVNNAVMAGWSLTVLHKPEKNPFNRKFCTTGVTEYWGKGGAQACAVNGLAFAAAQTFPLIDKDASVKSKKNACKASAGIGATWVAISVKDVIKGNTDKTLGSVNAAAVAAVTGLAAWQGFKK